MDANALQVHQVTSIEYGQEDNPNITFDFEELDPVDYEIIRQGHTIYVQVKKELITGYIYHFKVNVSLTQDKGDNFFKTIIHPRGIHSYRLWSWFLFHHFLKIDNICCDKQYSTLFCYNKILSASLYKKNLEHSITW